MLSLRAANCNYFSREHFITIKWAWPSKGVVRKEGVVFEVPHSAVAGAASDCQVLNCIVNTIYVIA